MRVRLELSLYQRAVVGLFSGSLKKKKKLNLRLKTLANITEMELRHSAELMFALLATAR